MRHDGIPYVQNPKSYYPPIDYKQLTLQQLVDKFIKVCAKANGRISECSRCKTPCEYGKRAIQLAANEIYNDPPVPLYGGKTLIERAKEENARRKAQQEAEKMECHAEEPLEEKPKKRLFIENWYEKAIESGDPVKWIMETYGVSKTKAKQKIYDWRYKHPELKTEPIPFEQPEKKETPKEDIREDAHETVVENKSNSNDVVFLTLEAKINELMKLQTEYKSKADEYSKKHKEVSEQIDVLCKAMDVFDKTK